MSAHPGKVSDDWTAEYQFSDLEIEVDGLTFGSFAGVAELGINQPGEPEFYVKSVTISGRRKKTFNRAWMVEGQMHLPRYGNECSTFKAHLFRKIEAALYADPEVQEWFTQEMEPA